MTENYHDRYDRILSQNIVSLHPAIAKQPLCLEKRHLLRPSLVSIDDKRWSSIKTKKGQEKEDYKKHESRRKTGTNEKPGAKEGTEENEENSISGQSGHSHFWSKSFSNSQVYESHTIGIFLSSLGIYSTPSHEKSILLQTKQNNKNVSVND